MRRLAISALVVLALPAWGQGERRAILPPGPIAGFPACDGSATGLLYNGVLKVATDSSDCTAGGGSPSTCICDSSSGWAIAGEADTDTTCLDGSVDCLFAASTSEGGPATTATTLAADGANCGAGEWAAGVDASGAAQGCTADAVGDTDTGPVPDCTGTQEQLADGTCVDGALQSELDALDTTDDDLSDNVLGDLSNVVETGESVGRPLVGDGAGGWEPADTLVAAPDGSATAPGIAFAAEVDVGVVRVTTDTAGLAAGGNYRFTWGTTYFCGSSSGAGCLLSTNTGLTVPAVTHKAATNVGLGMTTTAASLVAAGVAVITVSGSVVTYALLATAPATCTVGAEYRDSSGAVCYCSATNTWEQTNGVGTCV